MNVDVYFVSHLHFEIGKNFFLRCKSNAYKDNILPYMYSCPGYNACGYKAKLFITPNVARTVFQSFNFP